MPSASDIGTYYEVRTILELLNKGFIVSRPEGGKAPYDIISDYRGNLNRIQIKYTNSLRKVKSLGAGKKSRAVNQREYQIPLYRGTKKRTLYTKADCDFIIMVCGKVPDYYIIPIETISGSSLHLHPDYPYTDHKYNYSVQEPKHHKYKDAWDLLA